MDPVRRIAALLALGLISSQGVSSESFECNFGSTCLQGNPCGFAVDSGAEKWSFTSGPSSLLAKTGPKSDRTGSGCYAYAKPGFLTPSPSRRLITPAIKKVEGASTVGCVQLHYFMFGADVGILKVYARESTADERLVWSVTGDQGEQWNKIKTDLYFVNASASDFRIVIEAVFNTTKQGDIAVDDVLVTSGLKCDAIPESTAAPSTITQPTTTAVAAAPSTASAPAGPKQMASCDFGSSCFVPELCGFSFPNASRKWTTTATAAAGLLETGPRFDSTTGKGCFLYANSRNVPTSSRYVLESPWLSRTPGVSAGCVSFNYHMYGVDVGTLRVYLIISSNGSTQQLLWSRRGDQGKSWRKLEVTVNFTDNETGDMRITFELIMPNRTSSDVLGDMALDDINITTSGACAQPQDSGSDSVASEVTPTAATSTAMGPASASPDGAQSTGSRANFSCSFGTDCLLSSYCEFSVPSESPKWRASASRTTALATTGPLYDHTSGKGCYLYANSRDPPSGSKYVLQSPWIETTPGVGEGCVSFYYHMFGDDAGTLAAYVVESPPNNTQKLIWSRTGNQGASWNKLERHINFTANVTKALRVVFQVQMPNKTGSSVNADVALDDIFVSTNGPCGRPFDNGTDNFPTTTAPPTTKAQAAVAPTASAGDAGSRSNFSCSFGTDCLLADYCGLSTPSESPRWTTSAARTTALASTGPLYDHTSGKGCFLYANSRDRPAGSKYILQSPWIETTPGVGAGCVSFYYHMFGDDAGTLAVYVVESPPNDTQKLIWSRAGNQGASWNKLEQHINFTTNGTKAVRVVFQVQMPNKTGSGVSADVALDDLFISTSGRCGQPFDNGTDNFPSSTTFPTTKAAAVATPFPTTADPGARQNFSCDFGTDCYARDFCGFQTPAASQKWSSSAVQLTLFKTTGPTQDHTTGKGCFLYADSRNRQAARGSSYELQSPWIERAPGSPGGCVRFYYYMYGQDVASLRVYLTESRNATARLIWSRSGDQGAAWQKLEKHLNFTTSDSTEIRLTFEVTMPNVTGSSVNGDVALDDIYTSTTGFCAEPFDNGTDNEIVRIAPPSSIATQPLTTQTPSVPTTREPGWRRNFTCDFGTDCYLTSRCELSSPVESAKWSVASTAPGAFLLTGPKSDHTTGKGCFVYANSRSSPAGSQYVLRTPWMERTAGEREGCASFYYHMYGEDVGTLRVYVESAAGSPSAALPIWSRSGNQGNSWNRLETHVNMTGLNETADIRLIFEVTMLDLGAPNVRGDIALDDIFVSTTGRCAQPVDGGQDYFPTRPTPAATTPGVPTTATPATATSPQKPSENFTCDFGSECFMNTRWCGFTTPSGSPPWSCSSIGTTTLLATGPKSDHTGKGSYLFANSRLPQRPNTKFVLQSPWLVKPSAAVAGCVRLYYYMFGADVTTLAVYVEQSNNSTTRLLWNAAGEQGNTWNRMERSIQFEASSSAAEDQFRIIIEALMPDRTGSSVEGDIALDDVYVSALYNCSSPTDDVVAVTRATRAPTAAATGREPLGRPTLVPTTNGSSLGQMENITCDFGDNCVLTASYCGFSLLSAGGQAWKCSTGRSDVLGKTGPESDRSGKGAYVYAKSLPGSKYTLLSPRVARPAGAATAGCVSMYYHMNGVDAGTLSVFVSRSADASRQLLWTATGNQGKQWQRMERPLPLAGAGGAEEFQIVVEAVMRNRTGDEFLSDIAVDDVYISALYECTAPTAAVVTVMNEPASTTSPWNSAGSTAIEARKTFACNFGKACLDNYFCGMTRNVTWVTGPISTLLLPASLSKLPSGDHSTADGKGCYAYVNAKSEQTPSSHRLVSPWMTAVSTDRVICVQLHYYAYGQEPGILSVYLLTSTVEEKKLIWDGKSGAFNASWLPVNVTVNISGAGVQRYQIIIEAVTYSDKNNSATSVIAIDDLLISASDECTYVTDHTRATTTALPVSASTESQLRSTTAAIDTCEPACRNGGSCVGGTCQCQPGYSGASCGQVGIPVLGQLALNLNYSVISSSNEVMTSFWKVTQSMMTTLSDRMKSSDFQLNDVKVVNITEGSVVISFTAVITVNVVALPFNVSDKTATEALDKLNDANLIRAVLQEELRKSGTPVANLIASLVNSTDILISKPASLVEDRGKCEEPCHESSSCAWRPPGYKCTCAEGYAQDTSISRCIKPAKSLASTKNGLSELEVGLIAGACSLVFVIIIVVVVISRCVQKPNKSDDASEREKDSQAPTPAAANGGSAHQSQIEMKGLDIEAAEAERYSGQSAVLNDGTRAFRAEPPSTNPDKTSGRAIAPAAATAVASTQQDTNHEASVKQVPPQKEPPSYSSSSDEKYNAHGESEGSESLSTEL